MPGGSRGLSGPRPPRHLEWPPAEAAPAGAVAAAGSRRELSLGRHRMSDANGKGQVCACNVRAKCLHSVQHSVRRGKGQGREGEVGRARSTKGPRGQRGPRGKSGEGERKERVEGARVGQPRGRCGPSNVRATCLHRVLHLGRVGQPGNRREPGEPRDPRGTHDERGRRKGVGSGGRRGNKAKTRGRLRASKGKMRAEGAPHLVVYRAQGRACTGSEGGNKGQRGACHASCHVSCAQRQCSKPTQASVHARAEPHQWGRGRKAGQATV